MHLAMAFNKPVIAFFGATSFNDVDKNDQSIFINLTMPKEFKCQPCMRPQCSQIVHCSDFIDFDLIKENAIRLLNAK
jgi:ADP-heptose:LPS heptosyltransferase